MSQTASPPTPHLVVDEARLQRNIDRVADWAVAKSVSLRPNVKTHKCPEIARRQLVAGASGITVSTVAEAEVFAQCGFDDLFITAPSWPTPERVERLRAVTMRSNIKIAVDSLDIAVPLADLPRAGVLIEVDSGYSRKGVASYHVESLARKMLSRDVHVVGACTFPGHSYQPNAGEAAAKDEADALHEAGRGLKRAGVPNPILCGGSTPSLADSGTSVTDLCPGTYVFGDAQQLALDTFTPDDIALTCHATVVSHTGGRIVLDAGAQILGRARPSYTEGYGRLLDFDGAVITQLSDHHAVIEATGPLPKLGSVVRVVPNRAESAVNLVRQYWNAEHETWWAIASHGCLI